MKGKNKMVNVRALLDFFEECYLDEDLTEDNFFDNVIEHLPKNISFKYFSGATKLVILFPGADYVIKIPFNGQYTYNDEDELIYWEFENGSYGCCWDYCLGEVEKYAEAEEIGLENFFAKTELIGHVHGHPIYVQERATIYEDVAKEKDKQKNSWERRKSARELCDYKGYSCFNGLWILDLQDYCGGPDDELFCSFMNYVTDYISDLHMGNVGYIDGKPVLVDYSGFDS